MLDHAGFSAPFPNHQHVHTRYTALTAWSSSAFGHSACVASNTIPLRYSWFWGQNGVPVLTEAPQKGWYLCKVGLCDPGPEQLESEAEPNLFSTLMIARPLGPLLRFSLPDSFHRAIPLSAPLRQQYDHALRIICPGGYPADAGQHSWAVLGRGGAPVCPLPSPFAIFSPCPSTLSEALQASSELRTAWELVSCSFFVFAGGPGTNSVGRVGAVPKGGRRVRPFSEVHPPFGHTSRELQQGAQTLKWAASGQPRDTMGA